MVGVNRFVSFRLAGSEFDYVLVSHYMGDLEMAGGITDREYLHEGASDSNHFSVVFCWNSGDMARGVVVALARLAPARRWSGGYAVWLNYEL